MTNKLSKTSVKLLKDAINTASILGMEKLVIDQHSIRGESLENSTLMLLKFPEDMELEFGAMAITRVQELVSRMRILGSDGDIIPEFKTRDSGDQFVFRLKFKRGRTSVEFKCADPAYVKAPKAFNDPDSYRFSVVPEDVEILLSAKAVMQTERITFIGKDDGSVSVTASASEGDKMVHEIDSEFERLNDANDSFTYSYKTKILFPVLKGLLSSSGEEETITISRRGIIKVYINDIPAFIFPEL